MSERFFRRDLVKPDGRALHLYARHKISESIQAVNPPHDPISGQSHLRWHPLRGEWVAYASHRQNRTFLPPKEYSPLAVTREGGVPTELPAGDYQVAVFENLFPSLSLAHAETFVPKLSVPTEPGRGVCEVVVFAQDPDTSLAAMSVDQVALILEVIADRTREIGARPKIQYALPFENRGVEVGVTLHHPHGQIYAYPFVPPLVARMIETQKKHFAAKKTTLLSDMLKDELADTRRLIVEGESTVAFVPVCARYPYETWVVPRRPAAWLHEMSSAELHDLAKVLKTVLMKFDAMWSRPFPYLMSIFQAPTDGGSHADVHTHIQIFPPYRTRDRLKFLAGTELAGGMFVNDSLPEEKARELRDVVV
jgi:UDPglucose--hexose-1-phosphate uridylyltransferase